MSLSAVTVRSLKPTERTTKHYDGQGLFLEIPPSGSKRWRFRYTYGGKQRLISLGLYPAVALSEARRARDDARTLLTRGIDPSAERQARKASTTDSANSLEAVAREWLAEVHSQQVVESHADRNRRRLEMYIFPKLGAHPIDAIEPPALLAILRDVEKTGGRETARRIRTLCSQIWRYAIATMRATRDVAADLRGALAMPTVRRHQPALLTPESVSALLCAMDTYRGQPATRAALKLSALLFVRPGELRRMEWNSVDPQAGTWSYQPSKRGRPMLTPLPRQAIAILEEMASLSGKDRFIFPSARGRGRPMSENTVNGALHRLGFKDEMTAHGFRAMALTMLVERLGYPQAQVEMQLGHAVKDANGHAYNRMTWFEQRRDMLQAWADYLDVLKKSASNRKGGLPGISDGTEPSA